MTIPGHAPDVSHEAACVLGSSLRQKPTNLRAEQALLGALLANNRALDHVEELLRPEHFADDLHGRIYRAIVDECAGGGVADGVPLAQTFADEPVKGYQDARADIAQLLSAMVGVISAGDYGRAILDAWQRRQLIDAGEILIHDSFGGDPAALDVAQKAAQRSGGLAGLSTEKSNEKRRSWTRSPP